HIASPSLAPHTLSLHDALPIFTRTADRRHPDVLRLGTPSDAAAQFGRENPGRFQQRRMPPRAGELEHEPPHPARPRPLEWIAAARRGVTARLPVRRPAHSATSTASRNRRRSTTRPSSTSRPGSEPALTGPPSSTARRAGAHSAGKVIDLAGSRRTTVAASAAA